MKRVVLSIIAVAAALVTVSCNKEQAFDSGDIAKVTYTVAGPQMVATKAMGTIGTEYTLTYEVRLLNGSTLGEKLTGTGLSGSVDVAHTAWPVTVQFDLARGKQYQILFWAQSKTAPAGLFDASNLTAIAIDHTKMVANNEECDAFFGSDVITPSGATAASATLHRPFALVNLGTSDAAQFKTASGGVVVGNVSAKISGDIAKKFNVANGTASETIEAFTAAAAPIDAFDKKTLALSGTDTYNYLSAVYVLPLTASSNIDVEYTIKDSQETPADITSLKVTNVPIKTNYRTNITGKLLTGSTTYNISVDQAFTGDTNKNATPSFESIAALNTFFATKIATGPNDPDNGDIYPESVTVTAIPDGDATTITLPNDTLSVAITIQATYAGEGGLTIAYPTAEGAKHTKKVFFNMAGLSKLTANLPDTHLEVVSGSDIDLSDVHTSTSTFVVQEGARVGTLNIKQGNAYVAGSIDSLKVNPSATSDGQASGAGNAVQVFLAKESAVEKIVLNAKTDVVVEQPKDQIDVVATEKKVAVYVNEGAANSTATAQNGGVIYVEASVPCTVTAIGTSTAEEGTTVIVNDGASATGTVEVVATNGGAINLTANDDCSATATGSSGEVASTVTINTVDTNVVVGTETTNGGEVIPPANPEDNKGEIAAYVAQNVNTEVKYISLKAAVDAASTGDTIKMTDNSTEENQISLTKKAIIDLNGYTITFKGYSETLSEKFPNNAAFYVASGSEADLTIYSSKKDDLENTIKGAISLNLLVQRSAGFFGNGTLTMKDIVLTKENTAKQSIYVENGKAVLDNLAITTSGGAGGIYLADDVIGTVSNCIVNQSGSGSSPWLSSALAISDGAKIEVSGCSLTGVVPFFIFNSGGEAKLKNSSFTWIPGGAYGQKDIYLEYGTSTHDAVVYIYNDCELSLGYNAIATPVGYSPYSSNAYVWFVNAEDEALIVNKESEYGYAIEHQWPLLQLGENATGNFINAGVFNNDPTACLAPGYVATYDSVSGYYIVKNIWQGNVATDEQFAAAINDKTITISNGALLAKLAQNVNAGSNYSGYTVTLSADIDLNNQEWTPIGIYNAPFRGSFNGNNHTISHLKITKTTEYAESHRFLGLFGRAGGGSFSNVTIDGATIIGYSRCGALLGAQDWDDSSVSISNVSVSNVSIQVGGTGGNVGAVVGRVVGSGPISNVSVTGDLCLNGSSETWDIGGITGYTYANLANCKVNVNSGSSISGGMFIGGIVGYRCEGNLTMTDCSTNSNVNGTWWVGGLVGCGQYGGTYTNCTVDHVTVTVAGPPEEDPADGVYWLEDGYNIGLFAGCAFDGWKDSNKNFHESIITLSECSFSGSLVTTRQLGVNGYCGYGYDKDTRIPVLNLVNTSINLTE